MSGRMDGQIRSRHGHNSTLLAPTKLILCMQVFLLPWEFRFCYVAKIFRESFLTYASEIYDIGTKILCFSNMAVTRRRKQLNQKILTGSPPLDVSCYQNKMYSTFQKLIFLDSQVPIFLRCLPLEGD